MERALTLAGVTTLLLSVSVLLLLLIQPKNRAAVEDPEPPPSAAPPASDPAGPKETEKACGSGTASMLTLLEDAMCAQKGQKGRVSEIGWSKTAAYGIAVGVADYYNPLGLLGIATGSLFKPNPVSTWFDRLTSNVNSVFGDVAIGKRGPVMSPFHMTKMVLNCDERGNACERLEKLDKFWQYIPVNFVMMKTVNFVHKIHDKTLQKIKIRGKSIAQIQMTAIAGVGAFAMGYMTELIQIVTFKKVSLIPVASMYLAGLRAAFDVIDDLFPWLKFATKALAWLEKGLQKATCKVVALFGAKPQMCRINRPPFLQAYHDTLAKEAIRLKKIADAPDAIVQQKDEHLEFERLRHVVYARIKKYFETNEAAVTISFMFDVVAALSRDESEEFYQKIAHDPQNWVKANPKNEEAFRKWAMDDTSIKNWIERLKTDEQRAAEGPVRGETTYQF